MVKVNLMVRLHGWLDGLGWLDGYGQFNGAQRLHEPVLPYFLLGQ